MNRIIFFGRIHFKNKRSVTFAKEAFIRYAETIAKYDMIYRPEVIFGEDLEADFDQLYIDFERKSHEATDKTVTHTIQSMEVLLEFAIAGQIDAFVIAANELPEQVTRRVVSEKTPAQHYTNGLAALEAGNYTEAEQELTDSLDSYAENPWAYNARGLARFELDRLEAAEADFRKAREIYQSFPSPHLGLAKIYAKRGAHSAALDACARAMAGSIPHQPGYWISALFGTDVMLTRLEQDAAKLSPAEAELYTKKSQEYTDRYEQKLRQLGSQRNAFYPAPEELRQLQTRLEQVSPMA